MLSITSLQKTYPNGTQALKGIDLEIDCGLFGLLGPNGAGKTTLMRTIAALQRPDEGRILLDGVDIVQFPQVVREKLGYLPQEFGVYPRISAMDLLDHLAVLKGLTHRRTRLKQVKALLQQANLFDVRKKAVSTFSGGMRQRFGIAQALLADPQLLIVDEPTAGLDPEERYRFLNLLSQVSRDRVVILSTHIVEDIRDLCSQVAIMGNGMILEHGEPDRLLANIRDRVWSKTLPTSALATYQERFQVLSTRFRSGNLQIHVLHDGQPESGFKAIEPGLEDVYFSVLHRLQGAR